MMSRRARPRVHQLQRQSPRRCPVSCLHDIGLKAPMTVLMHLSDLHFGAHDPAVCAAAQRLAQRLGVAMVVVSGDLTQRATAVQFEQAARFVKGLHARSTLVLAGHHPLVSRDAADRAHRPHRADEALQRWRAAGAHMLLSGHVHEPSVLQPLPGLWACRAGTAVSHRLRHGSPNSLVVLTVEASGAAVGGWARYAARWDYDEAAGEFVCVLRQAVGAE